MAAMRLIVFLVLLGAVHAADAPPLLTEAAERWADVRFRWTFLQTVRETDGNGVVVERLERYDPSRGEARRWQLLKIDGRVPTQEEWEPWNKRKNRSRPKELKPLAEYIDLPNAVVLGEDDRAITYQLPLQRTVGWSIPGDKISLIVTINKETRLIERGKVGIDGPFNIALGLAKVLDLDVDLKLPDDDAPPPAGSPQVRGTAYAVVNKLGRRVEFSWSEFVRLAAPATAAK
jgi:hypothetical protein